MSWELNETIQTPDGKATVTALTATEVTLTLPNGSTQVWPQAYQEKRDPATIRHRNVYHSSTSKSPKVPKAKKTPEEKEIAKQERKLARATAKLAKLKEESAKEANTTSNAITVDFSHK